MANPFPRTLRSLEGERSPAVLLLLGALALLLVLWAVWFVRSSLPLYVVSATARLEAQRAVYPISAQVGGRVRRVAVAVGQPVAPGDVLIELEADSDNRRLEEERAKTAALAHQLESRRGERASQAAGLAAAERASELARREAAERLRGAAASVVAAEGDLRRKEELHASGLLAAADVEQARAEAERRQAAAAELRLTLDRLEAERQRDQSDRRALLEGVDRESALLAGGLAAGGAAVRRLAFEGEWRTIRAPVAGQVADLARLDAGALIQPGERLGTVIPSSPLKVVAGFDPAQALGRLRPGQAAQVRLDAFPWTQYGSLAARVARVSGELRDGRVWADLDLAPDPRSRIPRQHGLTGTVLVESERLSPARLLLRTLGMSLAGRAVETATP